MSSEQTKRSVGRPSSRACTKCGETDPAKFYRHGNGRKFSKCKVCNNKKTPEQIKKNNTVSADKHKIWHEARPDYHKDYNCQHKYNLSDEEYQAMFVAQFGLCAICGNAPKKDKPLCVDHCHSSNVVRALLCHACNHMLGCAKDNPDILRKAIKYLKLHST